jgi:hypothetical protein
MACRRRDGHRVCLYRFLYHRQAGRREADCQVADRRVPHPDPAAHRRYAPDEADDLRAAAALAPADADPADGLPAWEPTA